MFETKYPDVIDFSKTKVENKNLCDEEPFYADFKNSKSSFFQLFMIGLCNQSFSKRLISQLITNKQLSDRLNNLFENGLLNIENFISKFREYQIEIAIPREIDFYSLDEERDRRQLIIQNLQNKEKKKFHGVIFYSNGCIPFFNLPCKVLIQQTINLSDNLLKKMSKAYKKYNNYFYFYMFIQI